MAAKKVSKKISKKVSKKISKKVTAKAKPITKKVVVAKKAPTAKKITRKTAKKVAKKVTKKTATARKATARKGSTKKRTANTQSTTDRIESKFDQLQALLQNNLSGLNTEKAEDLAKSVWLAGLGAYSRTFDEISERQEDLQEKLHDRYEAINAEGQKVFEELVKHGKALQGEAEKAIHQGRETLEDRVEELKKRIGGGLSSFVDIPGRLREAAEKIEEISERLNKKK